MRRSLLALLLSVGACLALSGSAFSTGPGGWNHIGTAPTGLNGHVTALHRFGTELYLGGNFTNAGGIAAADRIVKWDGVELARPRHDTPRQRVGLRDRPLRRQDLRGRNLRQRRR